MMTETPMRIWAWAESDTCRSGRWFAEWAAWCATSMPYERAEVADALRDQLAELMSALKTELAELETDARWAHDSDQARLLARCERMEAAIINAEMKAEAST